MTKRDPARAFRVGPTPGVPTMRLRPLLAASIALLLALPVAACGNADAREDRDDEEGEVDDDALTPAQLENGIGPVTSVALGELDAELAARGHEQFRMKCAACHKMADRYVGPALGDVLERRTPAFVMNMILNPEEMLEHHPEVQAMLAQYLTPMPDQNVDEPTARALLEYLRREQQPVADASP